MPQVGVRETRPHQQVLPEIIVLLPSTTTDCGIMNRVWQKGSLWNERSVKVLDAGCADVRRIRYRRIPVRLRDDTRLP